MYKYIVGIFINWQAFTMHRTISTHSGKGPSADVFFEFNFFDGVMVDCKEVNNSEWGPWGSRLNPSSKVWDVSGLDGLYNVKNVSTGRELRESNSLNMESRCEWKKEQQASPKKKEENCDFVNANSGLWLDSACNNSLSSTKDPAIKKRVHFWNGENSFSWNEHPVFSSNSESNSVSRIFMGSSAATDSSYQPAHDNIEKNASNQAFGEGHLAKHSVHASGSNDALGDYAFRDTVSLSTGHLDWLWSEDAERQDNVSFSQGDRNAIAASSCGPNVWEKSSDCLGRENDCGLPVSLCEEGRLPDETMPALNSWHNVKMLGSDPGKAGTGGWASFSVGDSARCSSMSLTDLVETSPRPVRREAIQRDRSTLASHLQLAGSSLASQFCTKEADVDCLWPFSPVHSSLSTSSTSRRDPFGSKVERKRLTINDPNPNGNLHGVLHCTLLAGLPNYTFLLDDYDEAVTAKIWVEDIVLGEQQGAWRYTFYSLKGDSRKKGRSGWKHWRKKEKLASELIGTMRVSSVLCSPPGLNVNKNLSVESEFVLLSARANDSSQHAHLDVFSQTSSSSLDNGVHGCSKVANQAIVNTSSSPSQSRASSSDGGLSDVSSPGAISAWYVAQSLIPSSLGSPDMATDGKQKPRKWSLQSGISGMRIGKSKRRSQLSTTMSAPTSNLNAEEFCPEGTCSFHQTHSELAAMIINVPLELQDRVAEPAPNLNASQRDDSQPQEHGVQDFQTIGEEPPDCDACLAGDHICHGKRKAYDQHRQARITVILPSGNHGRPLSDVRGPSPLIKRWKEGGKCDCKGWDLGCGLLVLKNEHPAMECLETSSVKGREYYGHSSKALTLYRQDATEQEESYISLAPQENGLIAVDFRAPLSPLQAFAMAVAILHGRGSSVPDVQTSRAMMTAVGQETQSPEIKTINNGHQVAERDMCISNPGYSSVDDRHMNCNTRLPLQTGHRHETTGRVCSKAQGSKVFGCGSELALSFERL